MRLEKLDFSPQPLAKAESQGFFMTSAEADETPRSFPRIQLSNQVKLEPIPIMPAQS